MVAESVAEPVAQPEVVESQVTQPTSEPVVETPAVQEPEDNFEDVLALLNEEPEQGEVTKTATNGTPEPQKQLTEDEIRADERAKLTQQQNQTVQTLQRQRQIEGMRESYRRMDSDVRALMNEFGVTDAESQQKLLNRLSQHNGHYNELYQNDVQQAHQVGVDQVRDVIIGAVAKHLGEDTTNELRQKHREWEDFFDDYGKRYATKNGYLSKSEGEKRFSDGQRETLARLKKMGVQLPRGGEGNVPGARGGGALGSGMPRSMKEYTDATFEQRHEWQKADPNVEMKLIEIEAAR